MTTSRPKSLSGAIPGLRRTLAHLRPDLRQQRWLMTGGCAGLAAEVGLRLLEPWPLKFVVDRVITPALESAGASPLAVGDVPVSVWLILAAAAVVVVTSLRALAVYSSAVSFAVAGHRVMAAVRARLYRHLQALSVAFHARSRTGDLTLRVMSDVGVVADVGITALLPLVANTLVMFGMASLMLWLHWKLALLALSLLPLFWFMTMRTGRKLKEVTRKQRRREGAMAATAAESIGAIKTMQALSLESVFAEAFSGQSARGLRAGAKASKLSARLERGVDVLLAIATALVLWYGATLVLGGELTVGGLLVFLAYLKNTFKPLQDVAKYTARLAKASAAGERIVSLLEEEPEVRDLPGAVPAPAFRGTVTFSGVSFEYVPGRPVLEHIDLEVLAGTHVALVGPSGGGKSTLVNLVLRLNDPNTGSVAIDGRDIRTFTLESLRSQISVVLQETLLFAGTIRENLTYGAPDATDEAVETAARLAKAHEFIMAMPDGYDTAVGERGVTVSGGQRQRLALARAVIRRTPILILDEPTVGLDKENERDVLDALRRLSAGRTVLSVTHDLSLAARADRIVYVEHGRIVEQGTHTELVARDGSYATILRVSRTHRDVRAGHHAVSA